MEDFYTLLGLRDDADGEDIKKAYRKNALKCHPDKNRQSDASKSNEKFAAISNAYETLKDPQKRAEYNLKKRAKDGLNKRAEDELNKRAEDELKKRAEDDSKRGRRHPTPAAPSQREPSSNGRPNKPATHPKGTYYSTGSKESYFSKAEVNEGPRLPNPNQHAYMRERFRQWGHGFYNKGTFSSMPYQRPGGQPEEDPNQHPYMRKNFRQRAHGFYNKGIFSSMLYQSPGGQPEEGEPPIQNATGYPQGRHKAQQGHAPFHAPPRPWERHSRPEEHDRREGQVPERRPVTKNQPTRTRTPSENSGINRLDKTDEPSQTSQAPGASNTQRSYQRKFVRDSTQPQTFGRRQSPGRSRSPSNQKPYRDRSPTVHQGYRSDHGQPEKDGPPVRKNTGYTQRRHEAQQGNAPVSDPGSARQTHSVGRTASEQQPIPEHQPTRTRPSSGVNQPDETYQPSQMGRTFRASTSQRANLNPALKKRGPGFGCIPPSEISHTTLLGGYRRSTGRPQSPTGSTSCSDLESTATQPPRFKNRRKATPKSRVLPPLNSSPPLS
ncbi:hypothetical protein PENANT_c123G01122 [Penicillium antarcticum]|uniref:J domain-containing protein n=1 Tax=Penicillium antarcticum TaxID=416450 RepID=A0A1V6PJ45_9EURO|nr:hypothetical protein PENANT_c123G01122 [Penicillium antarcticum]